MKWLKRVPWFYFLLGIYPLFFLWANNKTEIDVLEVVRPLVFTVVFVVLLYLCLWLIVRNVHKASIYGAFLLLLFFSYGHIYYWFRDLTGSVFSVRHRILLIVYVVVCLLGTWLILKLGKNTERIEKALNLISVVLLLVPAVQLSVYYFSTYSISRHLDTGALTVHAASSEELPDVYFIVLDTYMRSDALLIDMDYDNSAFLEELKGLEFYVADCSRSNYATTAPSLMTTLNMEYLPNLEKQYTNLTDEEFYGVYIKNSEVRRQLESLGYKTVAFRTDFAWTEIDNADVFLGLDRSPLGLDELHPFEALYIKSTAGLVINDVVDKFHSSQNSRNNGSDLSNIDFPFSAHVATQLFLLDQLPEVVDIPGPKFVFVHILVPHVPYVFAPNGDLLTDPGYFSGTGAGAVNDEYRRDGYVAKVEFINNRIIPILEKIVSDSSVSPIIVLEGDHGLFENNRLTNLLAFHLPDGYDDLYSTITPINSFRLVLSEYFGLDYPLLPDISYDHNGSVTTETYPNCIP